MYVSLLELEAAQHTPHLDPLHQETEEKVHTRFNTGWTIPMWEAVQGNKDQNKQSEEQLLPQSCIWPPLHLHLPLHRRITTLQNGATQDTKLCKHRSKCV